MNVAFTGHRKVEDATLYARLKETLESLISQGAKNFICGGAVGFDTLAAQAVLELRETYDIRLFLAIPCEGQDAKFSPKQREEYASIRVRADGERVLSPVYHRGCMHQRNQFMVDHAEVLVAYCHRQTGGSAYTLSYAESLGKRIIRL